MIKRVCAACMAVLLLCAAGCQSASGVQGTADEAADYEAAAKEAEDARDATVTLKGIDPDSFAAGAKTDEPDEGETDEPDAEETESEPEETAYRGLVVIDPGHQLHGDSDTEPNGPGSSERKAKVSSGTSGVSTGIPEYELNLEVSLKLRDELEERGYEVIMTRETNDVSISNAERAVIANEAGADVFVRIHANGDDDHSVNGVITICQTASNPYNGSLYEESYRLSELILDSVVEATGAKRQYIWQTDTMTGINWAAVPSTIVEMGFMTNPEEDERMATEEYQYRIAEGIADGIDRYISERKED